MAEVYKHQYAPLSVYGNVVGLLSDQGPSFGAHVDVGCGYGAIAEPIRDELGLTYIGFDLAADGLASLRGRGFQAWRIDLGDLPAAEAIIRGCVGGQPIASLTLLDCLEHLTNGAEVLAMLRRLAEGHAAPLVVSVPNVAHKDIAVKLLTGRWDVTEAGLLDHTHVCFYTGPRLRRLMTSLGWRESGANDWLLEHSDQQFPVNAAVFNHALPIGHFLRQLIDQANPHPIVNQFVRRYQIDRPLQQPLLEDRAEAACPLLSVLIPVRAARIGRLRSLVDSLALQTNHDFDVLIVLHPSGGGSQDALNALLSGLPQALRARVAVVACPQKDRAQALNAVVSDIAGRYTVVLGEGCILEPHWCATLADLRARTPGMVLRLGGDALTSPSSAGGGFSQHIFPVAPEAQSSIANFAIPTAVFHELGLRFDPEIEGAEWDLAVQATLLCGVAASDIVAVSMDATHDLEGVERKQTERSNGGIPTVLAKLNARPLLLPRGSAWKIHALQVFAAALQGEILNLQANVTELRDENERVHAAASVLRDEAARLSAAYDHAASRLLAVRRIGAQPHFNALFANYFPDLAAELAASPEDSAETRPFLSIITRTQGYRIRTLRDTLLSLAGQTCQDFELHVVVHAPSASTLDAVEALVDEFPPGLRQRIQVMTCGRPGRAAPLNDALVHIRGRYFAVLDDDDFVLGHWVETFRNLAEDNPGALLRATTTRQDFEMLESEDRGRVPRATTWFKMDWPTAYDPLAHLYANYTPFMSMAFPASAVRDLGLRFDESLSTTEDWDFANRTASLTGVACSAEVTAIYRWWTTSESSAFVHTTDEWVANRRRVIENLDSKPLLLPPGSVTGINKLREAGFASDRAEVRGRLSELEGELERERRRVQEFEALRAQLYEQIGAPLVAAGFALPWPEPTGRMAEVARLVLVDLVSSRSWRWTRHLRRISALLSGRQGTGLTLESIPTSLEERQALIQQVRAASSWRLTGPFRAVMAVSRRVR